MNETERVAKDYLEGLGLRVEQFTRAEKAQGKTPDFRVYSSDALCCFVEVKSIAEDESLDEALDAAPPGTVVKVGGPDPTYNRLTKKIHDAAKQFSAVNPDGEHPNVLIFVNLERSTLYEDLLGVLTGMVLTDDGTMHPILTKFSEGRIRDERNEVDLYVWMDDRETPRRLFNTLHGHRAERVARCFGLDLDTLPDLA